LATLSIFAFAGIATACRSVTLSSCFQITMMRLIKNAQQENELERRLGADSSGKRIARRPVIFALC